MALVRIVPVALTVAFYLPKSENSVTLFDAEDKAGGRMRYGVTNYQLPGDVLDKEIEQNSNTGVLFSSIRNERYGMKRFGMFLNH